jgi:hypothetical protein
MRLKAGELSSTQQDDLRKQVVTHKGLRDAMLDKIAKRVAEADSEQV